MPSRLYSVFPALLAMYVFFSLSCLMRFSWCTTLSHSHCNSKLSQTLSLSLSTLSQEQSPFFYISLSSLLVQPKTAQNVARSKQPIGSCIGILVPYNFRRTISCIITTPTAATLLLYRKRVEVLLKVNRRRGMLLAECQVDILKDSFISNTHYCVTKDIHLKEPLDFTARCI